MPSDPVREAFEAYVRRTERYADDANFVMMNTGEYRSRLIECDWQRWQAAWTASRAAALEEAARVCESLPVTPNRSAACAAAIRALVP